MRRRFSGFVAAARHWTRVRNVPPECICHQHRKPTKLHQRYVGHLKTYDAGVAHLQTNGTSPVTLLLFLSILLVCALLLALLFLSILLLRTLLLGYRVFDDNMVDHVVREVSFDVTGCHYEMI